MKKFTLIEILVVVAVIGILLSLIAPSLSKARKEARASVCKSNLNQIGVAQYAFYADNEGKLVQKSEDGLHWAQVMYENDYLSIDEDVMTCPTFPYPGGSWKNDLNSNWINVYGAAWDDTDSPRQGKKIPLDNDDKPESIYIYPDVVKSSSNFFQFADTTKPLSDGTLAQRLGFVWGYDSTTRMHLFHKNKGNMWFVDGHVEASGTGRLKELEFQIVRLEDGTDVPIN